MLTKDTIKRYLISSGITFLATFAATLSTAIMADNFAFTKSAWISAIAGAVIVAVRALFKIIYEISADILSTLKGWKKK